MDWDDSSEYREAYHDVYLPKFFLPALHLFRIPKSVPQEISDILVASFSLFFCNPSSAANQARIALEKILDVLKVRTYASRSGKRKRLSLHNRIDHMPSKYDHVKELFIAIKWLGNAGSHEHNISSGDLFDLYEIFEQLLNEVYDEKTKKLHFLVKRVNRNKGPA